MKVNEIMVTEVATLDVNDELSLANDIMRLGRIRHLPVVSGKGWWGSSPSGIPSAVPWPRLWANGQGHPGGDEDPAHQGYHGDRGDYHSPGIPRW